MAAAKTPTLPELSQVLDLLPRMRASGVVHFRLGELEIELGPLPLQPSDVWGGVDDPPPSEPSKGPEDAFRLGGESPWGPETSPDEDALSDEDREVAGHPIFSVRTFGG